MKMEVCKKGDAVLVSLTGEIVSRDDQQAAAALIAEKLAEGERTFVLDLSQVPYVSSLGIAVLVATYVKINREGGKLRLVNPRPRVASILEMTKVADMFRTYTSVEEALGAE
jgi:anti-sigma B factor antagonist